jgi:predicted TIM-barrel fold metal-dependent hydrolase
LLTHLFSLSGYQHGAIDVHTHCYLPRYMEMLRKRTEVPYVVPGKTPQDDERYVILPGEDLDSTSAVGRPIGEEYFSVEEKIRYMDRHGIDVSVMSLANPWLDFLSAPDAIHMAELLNDDLQEASEGSNGRIYGFGVLPTQDVVAACKEVERMAKSTDKVRGVILGTSGSGKGLDDPALEPLWETLSANNMPVFLHPHYGLGNEHYANTGHSLFLALGFPFETTMAVSRLILSGCFDRHPNLKLLLAHAGGTLPFLSGRLDSCVEHDHEMCDKLLKKPSDYLKSNFYYDAVIYHTPALKSVIDMVGADKLMFGTDNPFFPPPGKGARSGEEWISTSKNMDAIDGLGDNKMANDIIWANASKILGIEPPKL